MLFVTASPACAVRAEPLTAEREDPSPLSTQLQIRAEEEKASEDGFGDLYDYLPDVVQEAVGKETLTVLERGEMPELSALLAKIGKMAGGAARTALRLFAKLLGILILLSAAGAAAPAGGKPVLHFAGLLSLSVVAWKELSALFAVARSALTALHTAMSALTPALCTLLVFGGNQATSVAQAGSMALLLSFLEVLCRDGLLPLLRVSFAVAFTAGCAEQSGVSAVGTGARKLFTTVLAFLIGILSIALTCQNLLAMSADTSTARAVKFAAGNLIPIVGGAVGDAVRTVMASLGVLKASVGVAGILTVLFLLLPPLLSILFLQSALGCGGGVAELLGCTQEGRCLQALAELMRCLAALLIACGLVFFLMLTLFIKTEASLG